MKKTLSKDYGKLLCTNKILAIVLVFVLLLTQFIPLNVSAATTGAKISNGIDYSGQGTIIDGDIRKEGATVSGNYVNIPVYTYGAYTYNTWDEFWAIPSTVDTRVIDMLQKISILLILNQRLNINTVVGMTS